MDVDSPELRKPRMQWCLCPLNSDDMSGDIFLPDQGEVRIGRAILGINDRRISRNHLGIRTQDNELSVKLLHKNPCHIKRLGQTMPEEMSADKYVKLNIGDQISLMCTFAYAVDFKDILTAQPPKFRPRTSSVMTMATEDSYPASKPHTRHHFVKYEPVVRHLDRGVVPEEEEEIDDALPQGNLDSHMSWRDPDKVSVYKTCLPLGATAAGSEVPGPDRYHQDWLIVTVTDEVKKVEPEPKDEESGSLFSNHSEEKCSYRMLYNQNEPPRSRSFFRNLCGKTPQLAE